MKTALPILNQTLGELANAFPPRRTSVPQPSGNGDAPADSGQQIMGFFTDTTLCIGCKACEVACKQWNQLPSDGLRFTGYSYDNTAQLSATTWRHVSFKEKPREDADVEADSVVAIARHDDAEVSAGCASVDTVAGHPAGVIGRLLMMSDVCKHCESAPCEHSCPTGAIVYNTFGDVYVQNDICNGCGYCISACPFGVLGRADGPGHDGRAHKCTLCMDRQADDMTPACAKSCPTSSIQFGPVEQLRVKARERVQQLHERGNDKAYLYGCDSIGSAGENGESGEGYGRLNAFFLLEAHPNEYNLPEAPRQPFRGQGKRYAASLLTGLALTALSALIFRDNDGGGRSGRRGGRRRGR